MNKTNIEWTDITINPVTGCTKISPGCMHCYAERMTKRQIGMGNVKYQAGFNTVVCHPEEIKKIYEIKKPARVFIGSMGDLFHADVRFSFLDEIMATIKACQHLTFQILTKRADRMFGYFNDRNKDNLLPNLWIGVTAENQEMANERIPYLLRTPAAVRFVSCEPLSENINLKGFIGHSAYKCQCGWKENELDIVPVGSDTKNNQFANALCLKCQTYCDIYRGIDWVIAGAETGTGARYMSPEWAHSLYDQCFRYETPFFMKKFSKDETSYIVGKIGNCREFPDGGNRIIITKKGKRSGRLRWKVNMKNWGGIKF